MCHDDTKQSLLFQVLVKIGLYRSRHLTQREKHFMLEIEKIKKRGITKCKLLLWCHLVVVIVPAAFVISYISVYVVDMAMIETPSILLKNK